METLFILLLLRQRCSEAGVNIQEKVKRKRGDGEPHVMMGGDTLASNGRCMPV